MEKIWLIFVVLIVVGIGHTAVVPDPYWEEGARGEFELQQGVRTHYPGGQGFVVWTDKTSSGGTIGFGAIITPRTEIVFLNEDLKKDDLHLLSGKQVVIAGTFWTFGRGEGTEYVAKKVYIFVINKPLK